jgi:phage shock protein PspC (stress-responsive transcriptional regulator)
MNCGRCGREVETDSAYCRFCGAQLGTPPPIGGRRLVRRPDEGRIAGVCAGMAEYFDTDVTIVRLAWIVLAIVPGAIIGGVIAYAAAWLIMPASLVPAPPRTTSRRLVRSATDRHIAGVCGGLAAYFGIDSTVMRLTWVILTIVPGAIVFGIVVYVIAWLIMPDATSHPTTAQTAYSR